MVEKHATDITSRDSIRQLILEHGSIKTMTIAMEECAELIQAISKYQRAASDSDFPEMKRVRENVIEEIADVFICINMICQICGIGDIEVLIEIAIKMGRNLKRCRTVNNESHEEEMERAMKALSKIRAEREVALNG